MSLYKVISSYNFRKWTLPMFLFVLYGFLTYGNYGYFRYNIYGVNTNSFLINLVYLRMPISLALASSIIYSSFINKNNKIIIFKKFWDVLLFLIWILFNALFTLKFVYSFWFVFTFIGFIKFFGYFKGISSTQTEFISKSLRIILTAYIFGAFFGIISIPKLAAGSEDIYFSSKTHFAYCVMVVASLILIINLINSNIKKMSLWEWTFILLSVIVLLYSGRRSPTVILLINISLYLLANRYFIIQLLITISSLFLTYDISDFKTFQRLEKIDFTSNNLYDNSYNERIRLREYYLNEVKNSGYLGVGMGKIDTDNYNSEDLGTHNSFLSVYYQLGIFGLFLWILIIIKSVYSILRNINIRHIIITFMLFLPFFWLSWVESTFSPGQIMFQYNLGIIILSRLLK